MHSVLLLLTSSFPFGPDESFLATELPYLERAFDRILIVANDVTSEATHGLGDSVECHRIGYHLTPLELLASLRGIFSAEVWREIRALRTRYGLRLNKPALSTILVSWQKGSKFARILRTLARESEGARIFAYSCWANDMAIAAARARRAGWVYRALCRAHGWDVYFERAEVRFLPFRRYLAEHLDHYLFVSEHGKRYFEERTGLRQAPSVGVARLGTPAPPGSSAACRRPFTLVSSSRMISLKRVDLIPRALRSVTFPVRWVHLGDGPTMEAVRDLCSTLPPRVEWELRGHVPSGEMLSVLASLKPSLFVNVSETEGIPVSMMEAMSLGVPVLGPSVGGVPEIVEHGRSGLLLPPHSGPEEVAGGIQRFLAMDEVEHQSYSREASRIWRERFDAEVNYPSFLERLGLPGIDGVHPTS